jgi:hypothetical protein
MDGLFDVVSHQQAVRSMSVRRNAPIFSFLAKLYAAVSLVRFVLHHYETKLSVVEGAIDGRKSPAISGERLAERKAEDLRILNVFFGDATRSGARKRTKTPTNFVR